MRTLFLGASGFLGQSLIKSIGESSNISVLLREKQSKSFGAASVIIGDLQESKTIDQLAIGEFERIIDCSWFGLPTLSAENNEINLKSKQRMLEIFKEKGLAHYIGFGSCLEYGSILGHVSEEDPGKDIGDFGKTKLKLLKSIENLGIDFTWFRPFYLIGSKQHENSLLSMAIKDCSQGKDFIPRNPEATYDYITVEEAVEAINLVIQSDLKFGVYNIGSGEGHSVNEIANVVRKYFGIAQWAVKPNSGMISNPKKLNSATGWKRQISLTLSIEKIIRERIAG